MRVARAEGARRAHIRNAPVKLLRALLLDGATSLGSVTADAEYFGELRDRVREADSGELEPREARSCAPRAIGLRTRAADTAWRTLSGRPQLRTLFFRVVRSRPTALSEGADKRAHFDRWGTGREGSSMVVALRA